jgi:hypothetical protein
MEKIDRFIIAHDQKKLSFEGKSTEWGLVWIRKRNNALSAGWRRHWGSGRLLSFFTDRQPLL